MKTTGTALVPNDRRSAAGLTLLEVLVLVVVLAIMAAMLLPHASIHNSTRIQCCNDLKEIAIDYKLWAADNHDKYPFQVSVTNGGTMEVANQAWQTYAVMSNYLNTPRILVCPVDNARMPAATNFDRTNLESHISYFIGLDADETHPQAIMSGDDNLTLDTLPIRPGRFTLPRHSTVTWNTGRHYPGGNIGFADGHVEIGNSNSLAKIITNATAGTNRLQLVFP